MSWAFMNSWKKLAANIYKTNAFIMGGYYELFLFVNNI